MNGICMAHDQNLTGTILKCPNREVLSYAGNVYAFDRIDAFQRARSLGQQFDDTSAAFVVAGWRFDLNQRLNKPFNLRLPRLQNIENLTGDHLIVSLRTVSASMRGKLTANPMPGDSGTMIVPRSLTRTGGSIMSSSQ